MTDNNTVGYSASGKQGNAADFEFDNSEYLTKAAPSGLEVNVFSISMWYNAESGDYHNLISFQDTDAASEIHHGVMFSTTNNFLRFRRGVGGTIRDLQPSPTLSSSTWYHIVVVQDTSNAYMYLNGVRIGSDAFGGTLGDPDTSKYTIGCRSRTADTSLDLYADGLMDEVGFWSKALSEGEIRALYGYGTPPAYAASGSSASSSPSSSASSSPSASVSSSPSSSVSSSPSPSESSSPSSSESSSPSSSVSSSPSPSESASPSSSPSSGSSPSSSVSSSASSSPSTSPSSSPSSGSSPSSSPSPSVSSSPSPSPSSSESASPSPSSSPSPSPSPAIWIPVNRSSY